MEKINKWLEPTKNKIIAAVVGVIIVVSIGFGVYFLLSPSGPEYTLRTKKGIPTNLVVEYGHEFAVSEITSMFELVEDGRVIENGKVQITSETINSKIVSYKLSDELFDSLHSSDVVDLYAWHLKNMGQTKPGEYNVTAKDGADIIAEATINVIVVDTIAPTFTDLKDIEIEQGESFDVKTFVKATDPIDGDVETKVEGAFEVDVPGTYELIAIPIDKNENKVEQAFRLIVKDKNVSEDQSNGSGNQNNGVNSSNGGTTSNGGENSGSGSTSNSGGNSSNNGGSDNVTPPTPPEPNYICPNGRDKNQPCDAYVDPVNGHLTYSVHDSMDACQAEANRIGLEFWEFDGKEVTNVACTGVNKNDPASGKLYRLTIMHYNEWRLNSNHQWVQ